MNMKMKALCAFALVLACSPAFAAESAGKGVGLKKKAESFAADTAKNAKAAKASLHKVTKEEEGKEAACPVTGEKFKVTAETVSAAYKGKIYYFCCPGCDKPFIANPEKYLHKKQAPQGKVYACPMGCAQSDKPGKCPKCGMNLVEKK